MFSDLRAGFCQALSFFTAPKPVNCILESVAFLSVNDQQGFHLEGIFCPSYCS